MGNLLATKVVCSNVALTQHITNMNELEDLLTEKINKCKYPIPGLSLSYISKEQGCYYYNYGVQDIQTQKPMTNKSIYHLFDGTNIFTATAIMKLIEDNKLKLTDPISTYLNEDYFVNFTKTIKTRKLLSKDITIQNLLTHSSPLKDVKKGYNALHLPQSNILYDKFNDIDNDSKDWTLTTLDALKNYGKFEIQKVPRFLNAKYNNFGYAMLGEIIENANDNNLDYQQYIKQNIFEPLKMENIDFKYNKYWDEQNNENPENEKNIENNCNEYIVSGYIHKFGLFVPTLRYFCGKNKYKQLIKHKTNKLIGLNEFEMDCASNNGIIGNIEEFSKFLLAHFHHRDNDKIDNVTILNESSLSSMQDNQLYGGIGIESKYAQGFGWKIGIENENNDDVIIRFVNHEGYGPGFTTEMRIYPDEECAIIVCCNYSPSTKKGIFKFMHQIIHTVFKCMDVIELELETKNNEKKEKQKQKLESITN